MYIYFQNKLRVIWKTFSLLKLKSHYQVKADKKIKKTNIQKHFKFNLQHIINVLHNKTSKSLKSETKNMFTHLVFIGLQNTRNIRVKCSNFKIFKNIFNFKNCHGNLKKKNNFINEYKKYLIHQTFEKI